MPPVTFHHLRVADAKLTPFTDGQIFARLADNLKVSAGHREPDRSQPRQIAMRIERSYGRGFGQSITFHNQAASLARPLLGRGPH
ncbi:hypothetical protein D3C84_847290 [compost metagenome]